MTSAASEGFPREVRITRSSDYTKIYKSGRKIHSHRFILFWTHNSTGHHRLGITVSRKVGNSVIRNRVKRLFREIFRRTFRDIPGQYDMVINAKAGCAGASYVVLKAEFLAAVQRAGNCR